MVFVVAIIGILLALFHPLEGTASHQVQNPFGTCIYTSERSLYQTPIETTFPPAFEAVSTPGPYSSL